LVSEENKPVPAIFVVQGNTGGHLVNVCFGMELGCQSATKRYIEVYGLTSSPSM
jgi:hypothetical protein